MQALEESTERLAIRALNRDIDKTWVDWAVNMLMSGYDTEHLRILAGETEPFNQFQMIELIDKVFAELGLPYSDEQQTLRNYACWLVERSLSGQLDNFKVLEILKDICIDLDLDDNYFDFYLLYFAKDDLSYSTEQWHWDGATRDNIETIITDYFKSWRSNCATSAQIN
jgi:hypothetical protein